MLYTDAERTLMATAIQPNMRSADIATGPFERIAADYRLPLGPGLRILDIGPGQCDFLDLARQRGAATVGIDFDPAICALGRGRGHEMHERNLRHGLPPELGRVDGIFCRGSINAYWFVNAPDKLTHLLDQLAASLNAGGWLWIAPWNNPPATGLPEPDPIAARMDAWCSAHAIRRVEPDAAAQARYGVGYAIARREIWLRGTGAG